MPKEEKLYRIGNESVTEAAIPQLFNLGNVFLEFCETVKKHGIEEAHRLFRILLRKQLFTMIQEMVTQPLTPEFLYRLEKDERGIVVHDDDYPTESNIISRANPYRWYNIDEAQGIEALHRSSPLARLFIERFVLEYQQIKTLINEHLAHDPILAPGFLHHLAQTTEPQLITLENGKTIEGFVSNWYATSLPATPVHKGGGSYFNLYRIIAIPNESDEFDFFVQKQGLFHKVKRAIQVSKLLNIDQAVQTYPQTERDILMKIIQLSPSRNNQTGVEVLLETVGKYVWNLPKKIEKARVRQQQQETAIKDAIDAIYGVFASELDRPHTPDQFTRLKAFFEGIGNPLYFAKTKNLPKEELVKQYHNTLAVGKGRDEFIKAIAGAIPTILQRVGGFAICGSLSAGGLARAGQGLQNVHAFGGLDGQDGCMTCPSCGNASTHPNVCSSCGFTRKGTHNNPFSLANVAPARKPSKNTSSKLTGSTVSNKPYSSFLSPKNTVGASYLFTG